MVLSRAGDAVLSAVESDRRVSGQRRLIPLGARISPEFLVEIGAETRSVEGPRKRGMLGLLFGRTERNVVSLEAFFAVTADCAADSGSCDRERLERALDEMLAKLRLRPALVSLELVGWCCVQPSDDFGETPQGCIDFHTRRFRRASDVLLIVRSGEGRQLAGQVYARLSDSPLSPEHYASGHIGIDLDRRVREPVYVSIAGPAESAHPELYFRTYESARALEKAERKEARFGVFKKAMDWRAPAWLSTERSAAVVAPESSGAMAPIAKPAAPEMAVVRPFAEEQAQPLHRSRRLPWIVSAGVLLMVSAVAVAFLNSRPSALRQRTPVLAPAPENASLGLRIHVQGDDFLITWDREAPAIQSAAKGVLRIQDGSERRITDLQPAELANGSIIYRPRSDDVDFLLLVYARDGSVTREGVRALDGTRSSRAGVTDDAPQLVETATRERSSERKSSPEGMEASSNRGRASPREALPPGGTAPDYVAPQPLKVVMPDVAQLAPESLPKGKIEVELDVDEQGRVTAARIPAGAPRVSAEVARAAIAAAKQWRFEPAQLHGKSIASKHRIVFDIGPH